ncbi:DUF934 domain-containing protein [Siculibacillus lacustris]|uniref:DUF934 domain-containing protein n=1 Tax=Siculibacillus lacustris TaxID=1549641 RepID=A0A4Q9VKN9_9HYPH|nr:DUF934 domain-containing protein [Siculibacillus lacustris]TBW35967.1 DUF934 domain-containing protein [Siculibacillus lacustris]
MSDIFRDGAFQPDTRPILADDAAVGAGAVFVSKARFLAERAALRPRGADVGVVLEPGDRLDDLAEDLAWIGALAVDFPKFGDGRGYSLARLARDRYGFTGEIRAIGDILLDQVEALLRVGFDTLVITHAPTRARLAAGLVPNLAVRYQPVGVDGETAVPGRPWVFRR